MMNAATKCYVIEVLEQLMSREKSQSGDPQTDFCYIELSVNGDTDVQYDVDSCGSLKRRGMSEYGGAAS
jgi:hypothetical protein